MGLYDWLSYGITHGFYPSYVSNIGDTPHYANDIGTPFHTPITALFSGTVVSQREGLPWGTEIFIQPDDSALPQYYYYHLDTLNTQVGEHLSAGQMIGLSGGQNTGGSNPSTPAMSSGPHTHVGFFTKYVTTPVGGRPYGPDISAYITAFSKGATPPTGLPADASAGNPGALGSQQLQSFGARAGQFVLALVFLSFGVYLLFKTQIDAKLQQGGHAARTLGKLALL